jgi:5-methylcytosine-specific restriction enzyme B
MKVWIEKTIIKHKLDKQGAEYGLGKVLISPTKDKRGADSYSKMREVQEGDIVIHLTDNKVISGVSSVKQIPIARNEIVEHLIEDNE